jgi:hypothetical protein
MTEIREDRGFGIQEPAETTPVGIPAKMNIEKALGIKINSVEAYRRKLEEYK